ncbi:MAG: hypothetical protein FJY75_06145, partial [Candidatus Eisenbacteria bacterium]|nr:hypothetical protein [Candidatus Eisenbacteria bacterium]
RRVPLESDAAAEWADRVWMKGVLDPERVRDRVEIVATGDSTTMPEIPIPPLPEEALQAPARFRIRYGEGVSIEIRNVSGAGALAKKPPFWQALWAPIRRALTERAAARHESVRLVLQLEDEDAAALYRSLPPDTHFMVLYE